MTDDLYARLRRLMAEHVKLKEERKLAAAADSTGCRPLAAIDADIDRVLKQTSAIKRKL